MDDTPHHTEPRTVDDPAVAWMLAQQELALELIDWLPRCFKPERLQGEAAEAVRQAVATLTRALELRAANAESEARVLLDPEEDESPRCAHLRAFYDRNQDEAMYVWEDPDSEPADSWTVHSLQGAQLTAPFRPVHLDKLPAGARCVPIDDRTHVALAIACETWAMVLRDIAAVLAVAQARDAWEGLQGLAKFYARAVAIAMHDIAAFEFREPEDPDACRVLSDEHIPHAIAQFGRTFRAQQVVALQLVGTVLSATIESASKVEDRDQACAKVQRVLQAIAEDGANTLADRNEALLSQHVNEGRFRVMVVLRPLRGDGPVLAILPEEDRSSVVPFTRSDTRPKATT